MTEIKKTPGQCAYCGSTDIDIGTFRTGSAFSAGALTGMNVYYLSGKQDRVQTIFSCSTCLNCGHMELFIDPRQIKHQRGNYNKKE